VLRRFGQRQEGLHVRLEARAQSRVGDLVAVEGLVRHREREHVGEHPRTEVLQRHPERPETAVAAGERRGCREQEAVLAVERLWTEAGHPVDQVLDRAGHRRVVLGGSDDERVVREELVAQRLRARRNSLPLDVAVVQRHVEVVHRREVDGRAELLSDPRRERGELLVEGLLA
jgi:hypothetical protein